VPEEHADYYANMDAGRRWPFSIYHAPIERTIEQIAAGLKKDSVCLNIGCGFFNAYPALKHLGDWHVCDLDPRCIEVVSEKFPEIRGTAGADLSGYADDSFDFIISTEVIEHVEDALPWLRQIFRLAAPGATVILSTPNYGVSLLPVVEYTFLELVARLKGFSRLGIHPNKYSARKMRNQLSHAAPVGSRVEVLKRSVGMVLMGVVTLPAGPAGATAECPDQHAAAQ
jgi:2-polyprenyl-3-methyl-5-hydroxy-6-metoxy-1,4-benzoquinol methylase